MRGTIPRILIVRFLFIVCVLGLFQITEVSKAQDINSWQAYTSFSTVNALAEDEQGRIWAATTGGVFSFNENTMLNKLTTLDGLSNLSATSIAYDPDNNRIVLGYIDGTIDFLHTDDLSIQSQNEIQRAERFSPRGINDFVIRGDSLFVATDFGIVLYDLESMLVQESYIKLGRFNSAISVRDIFIANQHIYCGTREGVAVGDLGQNLGQPEQWTNHDGNNGFVDQTVQSIVFYQDSIYAATNSENYLYDGQQWQSTNDFGESTIVKWQVNPNNSRLYGISEEGVFTDTAGTQNQIPLPDNSIVRSFLLSMGQPNTLWIGTGSQGLAYKSLNEQEYSIFRPDGPWLNFFNSLSSSEGTLLATSELAFPGATPFDNEKGYYVYRDNQWENYNTRTHPELRDHRFIRAFSSTISEDYFYLGSWGQGIVRHHRETDSIEVFDADNSNLIGLDGDYIVSAGLDVDSNQDVWATSYLADRPLFYMEDGGDEWHGIPKYPFLSTADHYYNLFVDSFDQKWISLVSSENNGRGLLVLDTGEDPTDISDDRAVRLTENIGNGNLPNAKVQVIREDRQGEIWIGTGRGVARFIIPDRIIGGGNADRRAQWLINADTTAESPFLLRDINATAMAVNSANQKWIGSSSNGVWLVNAEGSRILEHFTESNSPLLGNQINSITIDEQSGTVFFSTNQGLVSYTDVPKASVQQMDKLDIYPNPFSYQKYDKGIVISNLSEKTTVRVLSIDGQLVKQIDAAGGRIIWDGRDGSGNRIATGMYLVVAIGEDGDKAIGKIAIVR